jgi:hypothetical protein
MPYKTLTQMTRNMLDPVRGWWDERQLSRVCPIAGNQDEIDGVTAGMVGYLNASNQFVAGGGSLSTNKMPLFARGGGLDNDAVRYEGNMASIRATATQGTPAATGTVGAEVGISCLVGTGAYELGTTAYSGTITAGSLLMADATTTFSTTVGAAGKGKITTWAANSGGALYGFSSTQAAAQNSVIGIATSAAGVRNQYGVGMLYFYVNWWPAI